MSIVQSFTTWMEANSTITSLLAGGAESIFPERLPQSHGGFPAITYSLREDRDIDLLDNTVNELHIAEFHIHIWDKSVKTVNDIATTIKSEFSGFSGAFGSHTVDHTRKRNEYSTATEDDTGLNRIILEYTIGYY